MRILRCDAAWNKLACKHSKFYGDYVRPGLLTLIPLGPQSSGVLESEVDELIGLMSEFAAAIAAGASFEGASGPILERVSPGKRDAMQAHLRRCGRETAPGATARATRRKAPKC